MYLFVTNKENSQSTTSKFQSTTFSETDIKGFLPVENVIFAILNTISVSLLCRLFSSSHVVAGVVAL